MKRWVLIFALLFAVRASAQTQTTVTGTIQTPAGTLATSGTVTFTIKPSSASILYYVSGLNVLAPGVGTCGINASGQLKNAALSGACLVWGNDVISPGNTTYDVQFYPNGVSARLIHQMLISGTTYDLSTPVFANQVSITPQFTTVFAAPISANIVPVSDNVFNVGSSGKRFANGYFTNLTVTNSFAFTNLTVTGPLHVTGASTLDGLVTVGAGITGTGDTGTLTAGTGLLGTTNTWTAKQTFTGGAGFTGTLTGTPSATGLWTFGAGITGTGTTGALTPGSGILNAANVWGNVNEFTASTQFDAGVLFVLGSTFDLAPTFNAGYGVCLSGQCSIVGTLATATRTVNMPDASGTISYAAVKYCGATSGATQACAGTVEKLPFMVYGDVTLNTATTQSITTLPFTDGTFSCSGSDLTTAAGIVSFNTYAAGSVTIEESGGVNTDHLRYVCVGI